MFTCSPHVWLTLPCGPQAQWYIAVICDEKNPSLKRLQASLPASIDFETTVYQYLYLLIVRHVLFLASDSEKN